MKHSASAVGAALLAAMSGAAMAQSSVTLYGTADAGLLSISNASPGTLGYVPSAANSGHKTTFKDGGLGASNWGLKGTEDLGNGTRAMFQFQGNVNTASGAAGGPNSSSGQSFFNQMAVVGFAGRFGEIKFGRQVSPMYYAMASTDARQARYFGSSLTALVGLNSASGAFLGNNSNAAFGTIYNDSAIVYTSPTWNNLTFNLGLSVDGNAGSWRANSQQTATLMYSQGGLRLSALYYNGYGNNLPTATALYTAKLGSAAAASTAVAAAGFTPMANTNRLAAVGALYNWNAFTVSGSYFVASNPSKAVVPGGSTSLRMWSLGAGWKIQPHIQLTAGYYRITDRTNDGHSASQLALGLDYALSKRTVLYVQGAAVRNTGGNMNLSPVYATPVAAGHNSNAWMLGIRHSF